MHFHWNALLLKKHYVETFENLKKASNDFVDFESKNMKFENLYLTKGLNNEGRVYSPHFAYVSEHKGFYHTIHATSNAPKILYTFGTDSVPYAIAAIACAPPALKIFDTPHKCALYKIAG